MVFIKQIIKQISFLSLNHYILKSQSWEVVLSWKLLTVPSAHVLRANAAVWVLCNLSPFLKLLGLFIGPNCNYRCRSTPKPLPIIATKVDNRTNKRQFASKEQPGIFCEIGSGNWSVTASSKTWQQANQQFLWALMHSMFKFRIHIMSSPPQVKTKRMAF